MYNPIASIGIQNRGFSPVLLFIFSICDLGFLLYDSSAMLKLG